MCTQKKIERPPKNGGKPPNSLKLPKNELFILLKKKFRNIFLSIFQFEVVGETKYDIVYTIKNFGRPPTMVEDLQNR